MATAPSLSEHSAELQSDFFDVRRGIRAWCERPTQRSVGLRLRQTRYGPHSIRLATFGRSTRASTSMSLLTSIMPRAGKLARSRPAAMLDGRSMFVSSPVSIVGIGVRQHRLVRHPTPNSHAWR